jgi:hypothetical protein
MKRKGFLRFLNKKKELYPAKSAEEEIELGTIQTRRL